MVTIKSREEIKYIKEGGKRLSKILKEIVRFARPGVTTEEIDNFAEKLMYECGGEPAFRGYKVQGSSAFPSVLCISINNEVVHAPATPSRTLKNGDVVGLDIGMKWPRVEPEAVFVPAAVLRARMSKEGEERRGYYTDMAATIGIGKVSEEAKQLMKVTRESLMRGLKVVKPGKLISDIGREVEKYVNKFVVAPEFRVAPAAGVRAGQKYGIVRDLVGHGVGYEVHEDPPIPNYFDTRMPKVEIKEGMVLAIEPMITLGKADVETLKDDWTVVTRDGSLAAHFEVTVVVTKRGYEIVTPMI